MNSIDSLYALCIVKRVVASFRSLMSIRQESLIRSLYTLIYKNFLNSLNNENRPSPFSFIRMPMLKLVGLLTLLEVRGCPSRKLTLKLENKSISYYSFVAIDIDIIIASIR
jgi:hypothetical protein